jgi:hypothetical protein
MQPHLFGQNAEIGQNKYQPKNFPGDRMKYPKLVYNYTNFKNSGDRTAQS